jgi:hypothetical protein
MRPDPGRIAAARLLLDQLGVTLDDLNCPGTTPNDQAPSMPTLAEYLPRVIAAAGPGANRTYANYWRRMLSAWGERPLDQITASDVEAMQHAAAATARSRRNSRHGRHAGEHVIAAARAIYTRAIADNLIIPGTSPARRVAKPRRLPSSRRALTVHELDQINTAVRTSSNDVILDALLLRLHTETACRRGGALALHLADLDTEHCLIQLRERAAPSAGNRSARPSPRAWPITLSAVVRSCPRSAAALSRRPRAIQPALRPPLETPRAATPVGRGAGDLDPLAAPHHTHLGRTPLRLRRRSRLCRPYQQHLPPRPPTSRPTYRRSPPPWPS